MKKIILSILLLEIMFTAPAFANIIWPSLYISTGIVSLKVIIVCLLVELFFVKFYTNIRWLNACIVTFVMNLVSALLGIILIPVSGLFAELMPFNTFHWTHWLISYMFAIAINTTLEGFTVKLILKLKFKNTFLWLFIANAISILLCVLFYGIELGVKL